MRATSQTLDTPSGRSLCGGDFSPLFPWFGSWFRCFQRDFLCSVIDKHLTGYFCEQNSKATGTASQLRLN